MSRNHLEPLGEPSAEYDFGQEFEQQARRSEPTVIDRWLVGELRKRLGQSHVHIALWDEPEHATNGAEIVRFGDRGALWKSLTDPARHFGELYSAGRISIQGDILVAMDEAFRYLASNSKKASWLARAKLIAPTLTESRRNIHHHYDIGNEFYKLWLDTEAMQYTCAYYAEPTMTIEQAQQAKMHHVARKLRLQTGERVVEAGGGWGGLAIFLAKNYGVKVRSFNISTEQIAHSRAWAKREKLDNLVEFVEDDFRNLTGKYDAFVSVGMLEHVGPGNYEKMGQLMERVLTDEGRGLIHTIGRDRAEPLNGWINKRIFPGAYPPTLREMMALFEDTGLSVLDIENIRLHYAETLRAWLERYEANVETVRTMFDEVFVRAWRLYLAGSMAAFDRGKLQLFQVVFTKSGMNKIPWTRQHIYTKGD